MISDWNILSHNGITSEEEVVISSSALLSGDYFYSVKDPLKELKSGTFSSSSDYSTEPNSIAMVFTYEILNNNPEEAFASDFMSWDTETNILSIQTEDSQ